MSVPYPEVIAGPELSTRFPDTALVSGYLDAGSPAGDLIYLGFGETWTQAAPGLMAALAELPRHSHGYVISQYGLPRLQRTLRSYIPMTHRLPEDVQAGRDYEVAAIGGGTRNAMFDFARLLRADPGYGPAVGRIPVAVAPMPGWDYAGVLEPLGYRMRYLRLRADGGPEPGDLAELLGDVAADPAEQAALIVINAQHNPTGANWPADTVRDMVRQALSAGAAILLDDAYYGVHDPRLTPTSALRVLLEEMATAPPEARRRWLAVRSLGKQFHCNGWGIGAMTAHPQTLDALVNTLQFQRSFASAIPLQEAMATWLTDEESQHYLDDLGREYSRKRAVVRDVLTSEHGYPQDAFQLGEFAPYARMQVPPAWQGKPDAVREFREECLRRTGVLVGVDRWSTGADEETAWFRLFLGPPLPVIAEALTRLAKAGYRWT
ncbi:pyridoxal phosphate-dependent aminotransferase [Actinoallomurus purpureus]|uniref:pyridoxal phosphate-dependent aminotransferase n=1 Tax=Actinoallomurus purpureus TaxID=478114 RepID=UPI0020934DA2|nr:pyridoxal phosphate-dependent aminotransferase [Actinoallomurus purpureus]MCO6009884.1 pyridoxal phosphate-dependent aminotransferase [Actinoallomurus purpureus]